MEKKGNIHIRVDTTAKEEAVKVLKRIGISITEAIETYLRQVTIEKAVPFLLSLNEKNGENEFTNYNLSVRKSATINVFISEKIKKEAEEVLERLGLSTSTAIEIYLRQIAIKQKIPLSPLQDEEDNKKPF
jgi:hypothetical protein